MSVQRVMVSALQTTLGLVEQFLSDFSDAELLVRPVAGANHAAWQLGNIIAGEPYFVKSVLPLVEYPALPDGFSELHGPNGTSHDHHPGFLTKDGYLHWLRTYRGISMAAVERSLESDLMAAPPPTMSWAGATVADVILFTAHHTLMHGGQFSVIRRKLGKPVLM